MKKGIFYQLLLIVITLIIASCENVAEQDQEEVILAKVGDATISLSEFMRRTEMTIRPAYCNGDNNLHKKIVLNSLIAEKMLALEAGDNNELSKNEQFQDYIKGREEQSMRELLLHKEGFQKVQLEEAEIQKMYNSAGRTYTLQYFDVPDDSIAAIVKEEFSRKNGSFEAMHERLWQGEELAEREVAWKSQEHPVIHEALFADSLNKGAVVGPLRIGEDNHIVMKVIGWTDKIAISDSESRQRRNDVKEKLTKKQVDIIYDNFVVDIMDGKKLEFNRQTLNQMVRLIGPQYMRSPKDKRYLFLKATFNQTVERPELSPLADGIENLLDNSLFIIDEQVWSVRDFRAELQRHPLVFRRKVETEEDFANQFKLAIVDMVRDRHLTDEAYKRGYDEVNVVKRNKKMWKDALVAQYQKNQYLRTSVSNPPDSVNTFLLVKDYIEPYIDELQAKYDDRIEVNVEEFNKIKLTRIDMIVMQVRVPFPVMVPAFPQLTTDNKLDYGKRLE